MHAGLFWGSHNPPNSDMDYRIFNVRSCFSVSCLLACVYIYTREAPQFNPFTAMLAALSLGKWPIKVPILKSFWLFYPLARARERTYIQMHSAESGYVTEPSNVLSAGAYVCSFQPGNFTGWGSEGVKVSEPSFRIQQLVVRTLSLWLICSAQLLTEQVAGNANCFSVARSPLPKH